MQISENPETPHRILLVDDEPWIIEMLEIALNRRFDLLVARSAEEALAICGREKIDLLFTDFNMPETNGIKLIQKIRILLPETNCVLFSGNLTPSVWMEAVNCGARYILGKPISLRQLIALFENLLLSGKRAKMALPHSLAALSWKSELGQSIAALSQIVPDPAHTVFIQTPDGRLPAAMCEFLFSGSSKGKHKKTTELNTIFESIQNIPLKEQSRIAGKLKGSNGRLSIVVADQDPDQLLENGKLCEPLYLKLHPQIQVLKEPGFCAEDTQVFMQWFLAQKNSVFSQDGIAWLAETVENLTWSQLFELVETAMAGSEDGLPLSRDLLRATLRAIAPPGAVPVTFEEFLPDYQSEFEKALSRMEAAFA